MDFIFKILALCAWASCAAWFDWRTRKLPNVLTLGGLLLAAIWLVWQGTSLSGGQPSSAWSALGVAALLTLPGYMFGKLGAGDVKLLMAMGLFTHMQALLSTFAVGALLGLMLGFWPKIVALCKDTLSVSLGQPRWMSTQIAPVGRHIPYGTALAVGFVFALLSSPQGH